MTKDTKRPPQTFLPMALLALVALTFGCSDAPPAGEARVSPEAVEAVVSVAEIVSLPHWTEATGSVEPWTRADLATKIMGRIETIDVREGDEVRRGQRLVTLEKRDLEAGVKTAEAAVAMSEAQLENARIHHARIEDLHSRGSVTDKNLEDAQAGFRVAQAGLDQAEAALAQAKVMLDYATLVAPREGRVVARLAEPGDLARPGIPILRLEDTRRVRIKLRVPESDVVGIDIGDPAEVRFDVLGRRSEASVERIVPAGDPQSRTYEVQLAVDNPEGRLLTGMFARARFPRGEREALVVPNTAVVRRGELTGLVRVTDDGVARLVWVRLGPEHGERVEVLSGLAAGDRYLVEPPRGIVDGTPVTAR